MLKHVHFGCSALLNEARGDPFGWGTALQAERWRLRLPIDIEGNGGRCLGLTTLLPSCVNCAEIWEPQPPGSFRACHGIALILPFTLLKLPCQVYGRGPALLLLVEAML
jgi:hypothetical protein